MNVLKTLGKIIIVAGLVALVILGVMELQKFATAPREQFLQGQMEARRVLVAGKVPGRIERLFVHEGDMVMKDSIVAIISSPEIEAKKMQAQGALGAARAQASKARNGARSEDITALKAMADRAQDAATLAKNTYDRVQKLFNEGVLPLQKRDDREGSVQPGRGRRPQRRQGSGKRPRAPGQGRHRRSGRLSRRNQDP